MTALANIQYIAALLLFLVGGMLGIFYVLFRLENDALSRSKTFKVFMPVFLSCLVGCWILLSILMFVNFREFYWLNMILGPIFFIISAFFIWELINGLVKHKVTSKKENKIALSFCMTLISLALLLGIACTELYIIT